MLIEAAQFFELPLTIVHWAHICSYGIVPSILRDQNVENLFKTLVLSNNQDVVIFVVRTDFTDAVREHWICNLMLDIPLDDGVRDLSEAAIFQVMSDSRRGFEKPWAVWTGDVAFIMYGGCHVLEMMRIYQRGSQEYAHTLTASKFDLYGKIVLHSSHCTSVSWAVATCASNRCEEMNCRLHGTQYDSVSLILSAGPWV
jgi:hypothetical protein